MPVIEGLVESGVQRRDLDRHVEGAGRGGGAGAGASLVNDVTALRAAPEIAEIVAAPGAELCLMHMLGDAADDAADPRYDDVVSEVKAFLEERMAFAVAAGVPEERIMLDPGIGFGKTVAHNLALLAAARRDRRARPAGADRHLVASRSSGALTGRDVGRSPARHDRDERDRARARSRDLPRPRRRAASTTR